MNPGRDIPSYFVYGEPSRPIDIGFFNVEAVRERNSVHMGTVEPHQHADMAQVTFWTSGEGVYQIDENDWHFSAPAVSFVASRQCTAFALPTTRMQLCCQWPTRNWQLCEAGQTCASTIQCSLRGRAEKGPYWSA